MKHSNDVIPEVVSGPSGTPSAAPPKPVLVHPVKPKMPEFKRPWWLRKKYIDIQPMLWSLEHRPDEWCFDGPTGYVIEHMPSRHRVWVGRGTRARYGFYTGTRCSCVLTGRSHNGHTGVFSRLQQRQFHKGFRGWLRGNLDKIPDSIREIHHLRINGKPLDRHFAGHFA